MAIRAGNGVDRRGFLLTTAALGASIAVLPQASKAAVLEFSRETFLKPPLDCRPMVRWWWFGGAVESDELIREVKAMKQGGFGGFEIQPVYPLSVDDPKLGIRNKPYLSKDFLAAVSLAVKTGRDEGLRVDMTLGSGWPFGGPHIEAKDAASRILKQEAAVPAGTTELALPALLEAQSYVAAFLDGALLPIEADGRVRFAASTSARTLNLIVQGRTRQQVKRPTVGAEGFVLDHLSPRAVRKHLDAVGEPLLSAFGNDRPHAIFSDSLEVYGADWTDDLLTEFKVRRGYDLMPHLLSLFIDDPKSPGLRYDWGLTLSELVNERYLDQINQWSKSRQTLFRSQTYGVPAVTLSSNRHVDLAEGEGAEWRGFSSSRWASSANHIFGQNVTSAESWTWLHKGAFRATPLDIKAEGDLLLLSGINQFIAHGWPFSPPKVPEPGWALYAAAVFNDHNPWWPVMGDVNLYLWRMSYLLRQGLNVADVAILLPTEDAMSSFKPGTEATINGKMRKYIPESLTSQILDAGYNFDFIDSEAILTKGIAYPVLLLPNVERLSPVVYQRIRDYVAAGGKVIVVGKPPQLAPGFLNNADESGRVAAMSAALFSGNSLAVVTDEAGLASALRKLQTPDLDGAPSGVGFVHRQLHEGDLYFVANTTNQLVSAAMKFRGLQTSGQMWNAITGQVEAFRHGAEISLAPYESKVFVFEISGPQTSPTTAPVEARRLNLADGWQLKIGSKTNPLTTFGSWTEQADLAFYSGLVTYAKTFDLAEADASTKSLKLDFGLGTAAPDNERKGPGFYAKLDAPVRDAAEVFINGKRAGSLWCAPYTLDIAPFVKAGKNRLEIRVYNTAINALAGRPPTDYSALTAKYGERFKAQNMDNLKPLPSGLMNAPVLVVGS